MYPPASQLYTNAHCHRRPRAGEWVVRNAFAFVPRVVPLSYGVSVGVHPWYLPSVSELDTTMELLAEACSMPQVLAWGEIGIDRAPARRYSLAEQWVWWEAQWYAACRLRVPVVVHAVRSYADLLPFLRSATAPVIVHGFNGSAIQAKQLIGSASEHVYLSVGRALLQSDRLTIDALNAVPRTCLLLETDTLQHSIGAVYERASAVLNCSLSALAEQVFRNFVAAFPKSLSYYAATH